MVFVAKGIARADILETHASADITRADKFFGVLFVGVHLEQARNTFLFVGTGIQHIRTGIQFSRINTEEAKAPHIRVGCNLERQCAHRFRRVGMAYQNLFRILGICTRDGFRVERAGQVSAYRVEQCLHPFVLERGTANHRIDLHGERALADSPAYLFFRNGRRIVEVFLHQLVVELRNGFEHLVAPFIGFFQQVGRNIHDIVVGPHRFIMPIVGFHGNQIYHTLESLFRPDG